MILSMRNKLGSKRCGCSPQCDKAAFVKSLSYLSLSPSQVGIAPHLPCCYYKYKLEAHIRVCGYCRRRQQLRLVGVVLCAGCGFHHMHAQCRLDHERKGNYQENIWSADLCFLFISLTLLYVVASVINSWELGGHGFGLKKLSVKGLE